jgi:hypothetical protein
MKKFLVAGILLLSLTAVKAQSFNPFKVDISAGAAIPQGQGAKGGVLFSVEPKYTFLGLLSVGLRLEGALTGRGFVASDGSYASANIAASTSYLATADYYLTKVIFRPFVGAGTGIYSLAAASFSGDSQGTSTLGTGSSTKAGGMVRSGFEVKHFRLAVEYNFIPNTTEMITDGNGNKLGTVSAKNSYCGIKIGVLIGGGRR